MSALEIHGQADRFNVRPLEDIRFTIVCRGTNSFESQLLRVQKYSGGATTPHLEAQPVSSTIAALTERETHAMCLRPFLEVPGSEDALRGASGVTLGALICADESGASTQGVLTAWDTSRQRGIGLFVRQQRLTLLIGDGNATLEISIPESLRPDSWYEIAASYDLATGLAALFLRACPASQNGERRGSLTRTGHRRLATLPAVPIMLGASAKYVSGWTAAEESFTGTIEAPYVLAKSTPATELWGLHGRRLGSPAVLAAWDFSQGQGDGVHTDEVPDIVGSFNARCVNAPLRAVPGHRGRAAGNGGATPGNYAAIRLLERRRPDPERWKSQITLSVPETLEAGFYAVRFRASDVEEYVPFAVSPSKTPSDSLLRADAPSH